MISKFHTYLSAFLFFALTCLLSACQPYQETDITLPDGFVIRARIADTPQKTEKGLMFVKHLPENEGMLFVFEQETEQYFWMKNTLIDLDILFLNPSGEINAIFENVPHTYTYTPDYQIPVVHAPARYVLETAAGTAARHDLQPGQRLLFEQVMP